MPRCPSEGPAPGNGKLVPDVSKRLLGAFSAVLAPKQNENFTTLLLRFQIRN